MNLALKPSLPPRSETRWQRRHVDRVLGFVVCRAPPVIGSPCRATHGDNPRATGRPTAYHVAVAIRKNGRQPGILEMRSASSIRPRAPRHGFSNIWTLMNPMRSRMTVPSSSARYAPRCGRSLLGNLAFGAIGNAAREVGEKRAGMEMLAYPRNRVGSISHISFPSFADILRRATYRDSSPAGSGTTCRMGLAKSPRECNNFRQQPGIRSGRSRGNSAHIRGLHVNEKEIRLNAFEMNCVGHQSPGLWAHPRDRSASYTDLGYWTGLARTLERGRVDGIFLADVLGVYDVLGGSPDAALRHAVQMPERAAAADPGDGRGDRISASASPAICRTSRLTRSRGGCRRSTT